MSQLGSEYEAHPIQIGIWKRNMKASPGAKRITQFGAEYLNAVLEDGDQEELMLALRRVAQAFGGVPQIAKQTNLHVKTLYRTLSQKGNPELKSLTSILKAIGMRITVQPLKPAR